MNRILLFRFHDVPVKLLMNKLKLIRKFNPDVRIFGLYGGEEGSCCKYLKALRFYLEDVYCIKGKTKFWKWTNGDLGVRLWYEEVGKSLSFDVLNVLEWDLLALDSLENIFGGIDDNCIGLTSLCMLKEIEDSWLWTIIEPFKGQNKAFFDFVKNRYGYDQEPYACESMGVMSLPRSFLDGFIQAEVPEFGHDEVRLPVFAQILGFKLCDLHLSQNPIIDSGAAKYFNCDRDEIKLSLVLKELSDPSGRRVFHPFGRPFYCNCYRPGLYIPVKIMEPVQTLLRKFKRIRGKKKAGRDSKKPIVSNIKEKPFVSIVICTRNRKEILEKYAFNSIIELDYPNYEVIVIDDASIDGTDELVGRYRNRIKNLKYVKIEKRRSFCYTRNLGVKNSRGEIISYIDDDCYVDRNWLGNLVEPYLKDKDVMVVGGTSYVGDSDEIYLDHMKWTLPKIWGCNMSFRREIFNRFQFDENLKYSQNHDESELISRMYYHNVKMFVSDKAVVKHFMAPAAYRKDAIGSYLNYMYLRIKNIGVFDYYLILMCYYLRKGDLSKRYVEWNCNREGSTVRIANMKIFMKGLESIEERRLKLPMYQTLVEIPVKAKIKHLQEEKMST